MTESLASAVEKIYAHTRMLLTDRARRRMAQWDADNAMHKHGQFRYTLEEFGLSEPRIRSGMHAYLQFLDTRFGR